MKNRYHCGLCGKFYDINKDRLLVRSEIEEDSVIYVGSELRKYEKLSDYKERGSRTIPTLVSIPVDSEDNKRPYTTTYTSTDGRIQHRKATTLKGLAEALRS